MYLCKCGVLRSLSVPIAAFFDGMNEVLSLRNFPHILEQLTVYNRTTVAESYRIPYSTGTTPMVRRFWGSITGKHGQQEVQSPRATPSPQIPTTREQTPPVMKNGHSKGNMDAATDSLNVLANFVNTTATKGVDGLIKEYRRLDHFYDTTASFEAFKSNMPKNRYSDVFCADDTRVQLWFGKDEYGDYIHANRILEPMLRNTYICTQGPINDTVHDFYRMLFQERIQNIVMLCNPVEEGKMKCAMYWPEKEKQVRETPTLLITHMETKQESEYTATVLRIELNPKYDNIHSLTEAQLQPLTVRLLRWTSWPDRGVPTQTTCLLPIMILDQVRQSPTVVHCSAGIGRTGCLVALEYAHEKVARGRRLDFEQIVRDLRCCRAQCIQTEIQYLYIHRVMVEYALMHAYLDEHAKRTAETFLVEYDKKLKR